MLTADDILRIKEIADIIKESGSIETDEDISGTCVDEESIVNELSSLPKEELEKQPKEEKVGYINTKEIMVVYSLALKRYIIEKFNELDEKDINQYTKQYGGKQKTRMRAALNSPRFKQIYEACYSKNMQEVGVDAVFTIPVYKEEVSMNFVEFLNVLYACFIKSHDHFKLEMIKMARKYYKNEKAKKINDEMECVMEFLKYYSDNRDIFTNDKLADTLNEAGTKYGPQFMSDIHPILYIYSELLGYNMESLMFKQSKIIEDWLSIKYDDHSDPLKMSKLFIKMFYQNTPIKKKKVIEMAEKYGAQLSELLEAEKKNKENVRRELLDEGLKLKEARKKDDLKLSLHKKLHNK